MHYPGLPSHSRHALVQELFSGRGFGGMLAFEVQDGAAADAVLRVRPSSGCRCNACCLRSLRTPKSGGIVVMGASNTQPLARRA